MKEAYYFSHDSNARNDEKIIGLRMKHDWKGYGLFWALIEKLRDCTNYKCVKDYNVIAFDLRVDASLVKSIVEDFGLFVFTECGKYFYSERLCQTMDFKELKSKKAKENAEQRWKKSDSNANVMQTHSKRNAKKGKESKVKENNKDVFIFPFTDEFKPKWDYWKTYKQKEFKFAYKSVESEQSAINHLFKLSSGNIESAIEIIEISVRSGWQGLFPIKNNLKTESENINEPKKMVL